MKKILTSIITFISAFLFVGNVYAASASFSINSSSNQVIVGKTVTVSVTVSSSAPLGAWEYTLNYDQSVFKLTSSDVGVHYASYADNQNTKSVTYRYTFQALKSGSSNFYVDSSSVGGFDEALRTVNNGSKKVSAITYTEYQNSLSKNNNLKSLAVEGAELDPKFNKDTLEYNVKVSEDIKTVKIIATQEDGTATISGAGEHEVSPGNNVFDIVVIAQNGSEKTYKINIEVLDKDPIEVDIDGKKYTVVKIKDNLIKPESFMETTVKIDEYDIPGYYSEITSFTLVGLKNETGEIELFIYDDGKYTKYIELKFGNLTIYPLNMEKEIEKYSKSKVNIQGQSIECLETKKDFRFKIIYGLNVETGEEGLYEYDTKDNTAMRFDDTFMLQMNNRVRNLTISTIAFIASTILALIGILCMTKKKGKNKKEKINKVSTENNQNQKLEKTQKINLEKTQKLDKIEKTSKIDIEKTNKIESPKIEITNEIIDTSDEDEVYDIFADDRKKKKKDKKAKNK